MTQYTLKFYAKFEDNEVDLIARVAAILNDAKVEILRAERDQLSAENKALRDLADVAHKSMIAFEDWLGQASTMQAAKDSMWRLGQALRRAGYPVYDHDALDWRGSILKELNDAGFYPSTTDTYHATMPVFVYDPEAPEHGRIFGNAVGPTLKEIVAENKRLKRMVDWALKPETQRELQAEFDRADAIAGKE